MKPSPGMGGCAAAPPPSPSPSLLPAAAAAAALLPWPPAAPPLPAAAALLLLLPVPLPAAAPLLPSPPSAAAAGMPAAVSDPAEVRLPKLPPECCLLSSRKLLPVAPPAAAPPALARPAKPPAAAAAGWLCLSWCRVSHGMKSSLRLLRAGLATSSFSTDLTPARSSRKRRQDCETEAKAAFVVHQLQRRPAACSSSISGSDNSHYFMVAVALARVTTRRRLPPFQLATYALNQAPCASTPGRPSTPLAPQHSAAGCPRLPTNTHAHLLST